MMRFVLLLIASFACNVGAFEKLLAAKGDGFDGFGTPDPFNQNDDDQVDQGEPNAPDTENPNEDANMVSGGEEDDDDSFLQVASKKGDGFDGFGTPDPFNQNDDDQVDQGEPNAPDTENPNEDANMVSDGEEDDDDSFLQVASKKGDGFDGFGTPDPFNQNDDDQVDQGEPNAPDTENPNEDANMVSDGEEDDDDSFLQVASKKGDGFDGFGTPDPFNQNDDDQVDQGEPNAPDTENPNEDANMVSDGEEDDDDSFLQVASKKGDGFDGFGTPDPFNQNDDDKVDQGEPNAPDTENPNEDANMVSDGEEDDDDSFLQVASKKGDGFDGFGTPDPFNQNDDDKVDQGEPNAPDTENPNEDANMVSDGEEDDDDSFAQVASKKRIFLSKRA